MQTKRDQVQAYNFVVGRLRSALLQGQPDALETPTRRFSVAAFSGFLVGAIILAGCAIFGYFFPGGNNSWREPGSIIVEKETGTTYVYDSAHNILRPVLNSASARLLTGADGVVRAVSAKSLDGVRHGPPVGIRDAPDSLPSAARLTTNPWLVCATSQADVSGQAEQTATLVIGDAAASATVVPSAVPVLAGDDRYLLWNNHRLRIADPAAHVALGLDQARWVRVAEAWLNGVPAGPDLRPPDVPGRGGPGPTVDGRPTRVGQVLRVAGAAESDDFRLVLGDGLASLTPTLAGLILADPRSSAAYAGGSPQPVSVSAAAVVSARRSATVIDPAGLPVRPPKLLDPVELGPRTLCARTTFGSDGGVDLVAVSMANSPVAQPPASMVDSRSATSIVIRPGTGALVRPDGTRPGIASWLITDLGVRYPMTAAATAALGYANLPTIDIPPNLLALVPAGPVLDPAAANAPA